MYAQFALVIAATALISAVNAVTLKPTQCALWMRRTVPVGAAQCRLPGFRPALQRAPNTAYAALMTRMVRPCRASWSWSRSAIVGGALYGFTRLPTGFLPIEDQGT